MILKCRCRSCQHKGSIEMDLKKICKSIDKIICSRCRSKDIVIYNDSKLIYSYKPKNSTTKKMYMDPSYYPNDINRSLYSSLESKIEQPITSNKSSNVKKYGSGAIFHKKKEWKGYIDW